MAELDLDGARAGWWLVGAGLGAGVVYALWAFVGTFALGVFLYYATRPIYRRLHRRLHSGFLAAGVSLFVLALPGVGLVAYALAIALQELRGLSTSYGIGDATGVLAPYLGLSTAVTDPAALLSGPELELTRGTMSALFGSLSLVLNGLVHLFVAFALAFYLLRDDHRLGRWFRTRFGDDRGVMAAFLDGVDRDLDAVFFDSILLAVLTGVVGAITFSVLDQVAPPGLGLPYPALLGLVAGIFGLVPVVGVALVYVPVSGWLGVAAATGPGVRALWFPALFFGTSLVVVHAAPALLVRPYLSARRPHVGATLLSCVFGPLLFGWYGVLLGPILVIVVLHFGRLVVPELLSGERIRPYAVDPPHVDTPPEERADDGTAKRVPVET